jgi:hypothetical protein
VTKSEQDFQNSCRLLSEGLRLYRSGVQEAYLFVANELRKLLCDSDPLLPRVRPAFRLHKLHTTDMYEQRPDLARSMNWHMPGRLHGDGKGGFHFELLFSNNDVNLLMEPAAWIAQPFFNAKITVRELIKSVADKEGAHSDRNYNETLLRAKAIQMGTHESHIPAVVAIGEYLLNHLQYSRSLVP